MQTAMIVVFIMFIPASAMAYVGPGLGAGVISLVLGVLGSVIIALIALIWYPTKRLISTFRKSCQRDSTQQ